MLSLFSMPRLISNGIVSYDKNINAYIDLYSG